MKILKFFFVILIVFTTSSCVKNWWKPRGYLLFSMMPKGGSPGFNLGWIHGCESGAGTQFGGAIFQSFYTWQRDADISSSKPNIERIKRKYGKKELKDVDWNDPRDIKDNFSDYNSIFWAAHFLCRQVVLGTLQMSDMDPVLPGGKRFEPSKHNIGSVYKINGKGDVRLGSQRTGGHW